VDSVAKAEPSAVLQSFVEDDDHHVQMPENGVIFSDGIESDHLEFNSGALATIGVAEKQGLLTV
jgi:hypothetical protein